MNIIDEVRNINAKYEQEIKSLIPEVEEYVKNLAKEYFDLEKVVGVQIQVGYDDSCVKELQVNVFKDIEKGENSFYTGYDYKLSEELYSRITQELSNILINMEPNGFYFSIGDVDY
jgi:hypothetical protein